MTVVNPTLDVIYQNIFEENLHLSSKGAVLAFSGKKTGRVPDAKRVVNDSNTKSIWWDNVKPISPQLFSWYQKYAQNILTNEKHYVSESLAGWNYNYSIKVQVKCLEAYHCLFMQNMLIPLSSNLSTGSSRESDINQLNNKYPQFNIYNVGKHSLVEATDWILKQSDVSPDVLAEINQSNLTPMYLLWP